MVARAAWWSRPGDRHPFLMDILDLDGDSGDGRLVRTALATFGVDPPDYLRYVPGDWRDQPAVRRGVEQRMGVLESLGARLFVERLRLEWRPGTPLPEPAGRLVFRPVRDADESRDPALTGRAGPAPGPARAQLGVAPAVATPAKGMLAAWVLPSPSGWCQRPRRRSSGSTPSPNQYASSRCG